MKAGLFALIATVCALAPGLAQARPRDEVMSGAFRCAAIGETRQWLDCYYGAAQPARAGLGLPPAPEAQLKLARFPPSGEAADTAQRDAAMAGAFRCNSLTGERQWLDCYYAAAQPVRAHLGLSPALQAGLASTAAAPPPAPTPAEQAFGQPRPAAKNADRMVSRMATYSFDRYGIFTATLSNGQVWRQLSDDSAFARWNKPAETYLVSISHGWLGSYNFQVKDSPGMFKVRRER